MLTNIRAIIFDFGGVLLEWDPHRLFRPYFTDAQEMERFLAEINFQDWNLEQDKGRPFSKAVAELSAKFPQYSHLIRAYHEKWDESIVGQIQGTVNILHDLDKRGFPLYGLSNWSHETFSLIRTKYPFFDLFKDIIISGAVKIIKPDPRIFLIALDRIGYPANECLLIDDSTTNVVTAQRMGWNTIQFHSPQQLEQEVRQFGLL